MESLAPESARVTGISRKLAQALLKLSDNMTTGRPYNPMSTPPTTVRDGETFVAPDDQPLVEFIREHAAAKRVVIQARQRLSGGAIQENWLLDLLIEGGPGWRPALCCAAMRFPRYRQP